MCVCVTYLVSVTLKAKTPNPNASPPFQPWTLLDAFGETFACQHSVGGCVHIAKRHLQTLVLLNKGTLYKGSSTSRVVPKICCGYFPANFEGLLLLTALFMLSQLHAVVALNLRNPDMLDGWENISKTTPGWSIFVLTFRFTITGYL